METRWREPRAWLVGSNFNRPRQAQFVIRLVGEDPVSADEDQVEVHGVAPLSGGK
jgi:hypothetical protein